MQTRVKLSNLNSTAGAPSARASCQVKLISGIQLDLQVRPSTKHSYSGQSRQGSRIILTKVCGLNQDVCHPTKDVQALPRKELAAQFCVRQRRNRDGWHVQIVYLARFAGCVEQGYARKLPSIL